MAFHISAAYSVMVRSLENFPEPATFKMALAHPGIGFGIQGEQALVGCEIRLQIRQMHVVVEAFARSVRDVLSQRWIRTTASLV